MMSFDSSKPNTLTDRIMARDPYLPPEVEAPVVVVYRPDCEIIRGLVLDMQGSDPVRREEAKEAVDNLFRATVGKPLQLILQFSGMELITMTPAAFSTHLLTTVYNNCMSTWGPPLSRERLFQIALTDWLCVIVTWDFR